MHDALAWLKAMISSNKKEFIIEYLPNSIRAARLSSKKAPLVVEDLMEFPMSNGTPVQDKLRKFAGAKGNGFINGVCAVYPKNRIVRRFALDAPKGKETDQVLEFIRKDLQMDPDAIKAFCLSASNGHDGEPADFNKKSVLLCGAPKEELDGLQETLLSNAIYPTSIEIGTVGMIGLLKDVIHWSENQNPLLFIEMEDEFCNALIIGANGIEMSRHIDFGVKEIAAALKTALNIKDDKAAEKLIASNDFDFGNMAAKILRRLLRELQSSIGFFEVQTGQTVSRVLAIRKEGKMKWLQDGIANMLNLESWMLDIPKWLESKKVSFAKKEHSKKVDQTWLGLAALMCQFDKEEAKK